MTTPLQVIGALRAANLIALRNSVHFPDPGPMNEARGDVCSALQDLIACLMENRAPLLPLDRISDRIETWKLRLIASGLAGK